MDNKQAIFDEKIRKSVEDLTSLCYQYGIPCFMAFGVADDKHNKGRLQLQVSTHLPETLKCEPNDRTFSDFVNIARLGFTTVPNNDASNWSMDTRFNIIDGEGPDEAEPGDDMSL